MSKASRTAVARGTVAALEAKQFKPPGGRILSLGEDLDLLRRETKVILPEENLPLPQICTSPSLHHIHLEFLHTTTLGGCSRSLGSNLHVGALNFASGKNPGGGFLTGAQAQEESIARTSTLYYSLTLPSATREYYKRHEKQRPNNGIYSHTIILSPRVLIFRDESTGALLAEPFKVTIVTCPAVNAGHARKILGAGEQTEQRIRQTMRERVERILAVFQREQVDVVVLGAYGCGVFKNSVVDVAKVFREVLEQRQWQFSRVVFAITEERMLQTFGNEFGVNGSAPSIAAANPSRPQTSSPSKPVLRDNSKRNTVFQGRTGASVCTLNFGQHPQ